MFICTLLEGVVIWYSLLCVYIGAVPLISNTPGVLFGQVLNFDCEGDEMQLSDCMVSSLPYANYDHTDDAGVTCERCVDCCDLGSTRDACMTTESPTRSATEMMETQKPATDSTIAPMTDSTDGTYNSGVSDRTIMCSNNETILGAIVGILIVLLVAVIIGWIATCILFKSKTKEKYTVNFDHQ